MALLSWIVKWFLTSLTLIVALCMIVGGLVITKAEGEFNLNLEEIEEMHDTALENNDK